MAFDRSKRVAVDPNRDPKLPKPHPYTERAARDFDTTSLRESIHKSTVHRDYAAHWFRWGFACRFIKAGMVVYDVGCGQDQMLAKVVRRSLTTVPAQYVGCDLNSLSNQVGFKWSAVHEKFDFIARHGELLKKYGPADVLVNFEMIEHMSKASGQKLLKAIAKCLKPEGTALLSTPVYNERHMAANHIHEYRDEELATEIRRAGLEVVRRHGTFMTANVIKKVATKEERALIEELSQFYAWDVLANFLAPKYPEAASNICWVLRRKQ